MFSTLCAAKAINAVGCADAAGSIKSVVFFPPPPPRITDTLIAESVPPLFLDEAGAGDLMAFNRGDLSLGGESIFAVAAAAFARAFTALAFILCKINLRGETSRAGLLDFPPPKVVKLPTPIAPAITAPLIPAAAKLCNDVLRDKARSALASSDV